VAGARRDLGQSEVAVHSLREVVDHTRDGDEWAARLYYAFADALSAAGSSQEAADWLARAARLDPAGETDARERLNIADADVDGDGIESVSDLDQEI